MKEDRHTKSGTAMGPEPIPMAHIQLGLVPGEDITVNYDIHTGCVLSSVCMG